MTYTSRNAVDSIAWLDSIVRGKKGAFTSITGAASRILRSNPARKEEVQIGLQRFIEIYIGLHRFTKSLIP